MAGFRGNPLLSLITVAVVVFNFASATLDPIVVKGSKFFFKTNGTQFYIRGIAYQAGFSSNGTTTSNDDYVDPLADASTCSRDIPYLQALDTNVIRTYALDPTVDHSQCMAMLDAAGIYLISDLSEPALSINREDPAWNTELYARYTAVVDAMANYTNVIGFFAGNEVTNNLSYTGASAYVKAAVRDTKAYISQKGYRQMYVGYAADDDPSVRLNVANYFNCGDDTADNIDFWGYNIYSWCGDSSYITSGYVNRTQEFSNYSVPVFFAEYGCNTVGGAAERPFTEVAALFGPDMDEVFSGGIVYEYFEETNDYGLVSVSGNSVSTLADFNSYSSQIHAATPTIVQAATYTPTNTAGQACPTVDADWEASTNLPPTPNQAVCSCMMASLSCIAKSTIETTDIGTLFSQVCGYNGGKPCVGIAANTSTGVYGAYSMCNSTEQLSYAFNAYYQEENSNSQACDFNGAAQVVKAAGAASSCSSIIASATSASPGSPTSSGSGSSSTTTKKSEAGNVRVGASLGLGMGAWVTYVVVAMLSGAGMMLL